MDELDLDTRIIRRNVAKGFVARAAIDERLTALPDVGERADYFDPYAEEEPTTGADAAAEPAPQADET